MAKRGYKVLDSDLHLMEPADLYSRYLAPEFMGRAPRATHDQPGHYAGWVLEGQPIPPWIGDDQVLRANAEMDLRSRQVMKDGWDRHFDAGSSPNSTHCGLSWSGFRCRPASTAPPARSPRNSWAPDWPVILGIAPCLTPRCSRWSR